MTPMMDATRFISCQPHWQRVSRFYAQTFSLLGWVKLKQCGLAALKTISVSDLDLLFYFVDKTITTLFAPDMNDPYKYRFFLSDSDTDGFLGNIYIGIRELNTTDYDMDVTGGCASIPRYANGADYFQGTFEMRQYVSQCFALSDSDSDWSMNGCQVRG